jgi:predicted nucleic acid-binding protein
LLVLLDTTILTNFALVGLTALLKDLWGDLAATIEAVLEEYVTGVNTGKLPNENWAHLTIVTLSSGEHVLGIKLFPKYGKGERSCLTLAVSRGAILATDDQLARRAAKLHGIEFIGTIGILKTCVQTGLLSPLVAQQKLEEMIAAGYYSPILRLDLD